MKHIFTLLCVFLICSTFGIAVAAENSYLPTPIKCQWNSKKVAFLGDSITDKIHVGTKKNYWQFLQDYLAIEPCVYGINGNTYKNILAQAQKLKTELGDGVDTIVVFAGTNDFNAALPIGEWYSYSDAPAPVANGKTEIRKRRSPIMTDTTFKGRINIALDYLKKNFPDAQIILMTPIHRGFAKFSENNVQPDESFPNRIGLYINSYVDAVKEAANIWAVPVIDLNSICGLYPNCNSHAKYFANTGTDRLHPNAEGHRRMAQTIAYQLLGLPAEFKSDK